MPRLDRTFNDEDLKRIICHYLSSDEKARLTDWLVSKQAKECGIVFDVEKLKEIFNLMSKPELGELLALLTMGSFVTSTGTVIAAFPCYTGRYLIFILETVQQLRPICGLMSILDGPCDVAQAFMATVRKILPKQYKILVTVMLLSICINAELCFNLFMYLEDTELDLMINVLKGIYRLRCGEYEPPAVFSTLPLPASVLK